jgi:hypothetical protein
MFLRGTAAVGFRPPNLSERLLEDNYTMSVVIRETL